MPRHVEKRKGEKPYKIVEPSGRVVGSSTSRKKAQASANAANASAHNWKPTKRKR